MASFLHTLGRELAGAGRECLDAVYPLRCRLCGAAAEDGVACAEHVIPCAPPGPRCGRCAAGLPPAIVDGERCAGCRIHAPAFTRVVALADWGLQPRIRPWILAFKHGGRRDLARPLARALGQRLAADELADCVWVSVPLHPLRRLERGYDQAALLANELQRVSGVPALRLMARTRATAVQGEPGSVSRAANVRDAFRGRRRAARQLSGRAVWIVDDVVTSGSTASECAKILRRLGAARVGVACLARAGGDKPASVSPSHV